MRERGSATGALMTILLLAGLLTLGVKYFKFDEALAPFASKWQSWLEAGSLPTGGKIFKKPQGKGKKVAIVYAYPGQCYGKEDREGLGEIVAVGEVLAQALEELGIEVLHKPDAHTASYSQAQKEVAAVAKALQESENVALVLDLHREAAPAQLRQGYQLAAKVEGKAQRLARLQLFVPQNDQKLGLLAGSIWSGAEELYPGLVRGLVRGGNAEVITMMMGDWQGNTLPEAQASAKLLAKVLAQVLQ